MGGAEEGGWAQQLGNTDSQMKLFVQYGWQKQPQLA